MNLIRYGALGDVVLLGSVTSAISGGCTVVTRPRYHALVRRMKGVNDVRLPGAPLEGPVIDLQRSIRTMWRYPGARRIRKYSVRRRLWGRPAVTELYGRAVGVRPVSTPWFRLQEQHRDVLVLVPGASVPLKQCPNELLVRSARSWKGPVVVVGGPGEERLCRRLASDVDAEWLVEEGFSRTLDVFARARWAVGGDTGLMHLAGACGVVLSTFFGPTHPRDGFAVHGGEHLQRSISCRPCSLHRVEMCHTGTRACRSLGDTHPSLSV